MCDDYKQVMSGVWRWSIWVLVVLGLQQSAWADPPPRQVLTKPAKAVVWHRPLRAVGQLVARHGINITATTPGLITKLYVASGQHVHQGEPLVSIDGDYYRGQLEKARAQLDLNRLQYERAKRLFARRVVTAWRLDQARSDYRASRGQLMMAQSQYDHAVIRAPFAGVVGLTHAQIGASVSPGQALMSLQDDKHLWVDFRLPMHLSHEVALKRALQCERTQSSKGRLKGHVIAIDPLVDAHTQSRWIRGVLDTHSGGWQPGEMVKVTLQAHTGQQVIQVPAVAVLADLGGQYVYVVEAGQAQRRNVHVLDQQGATMVLDRGLSGHEKVVTQGHQMLFPGAPVMQDQKA